MAGISVNDLQEAIMEKLREYGDVIYQATEEGLNAAENTLIEVLSEASPKDTGKFAQKWRGKGKKYKLRRYVGNTTTVKGAKSDTIPLSNILEYSEKSPHQGFIKKTFDENINKIAAAVVAEIKKEAK